MITGQLATAITTDGLELKGFWVNNKSDTAVFHSHGTAGDFYTHKFIETEAASLSHLDISFLTANNRGHDVYANIRKHDGKKVTWQQAGGAFEKFDDCLKDIDAWLDFLSKQSIKKVILQAHSLTQKILYYQHIKKNPQVIGQIHLSPCNDAGYMYYLLGVKKYKQTNRMIKAMVKKGDIKTILPLELSVVCPMGAQPYLDYLTEDGIGNLFPYHFPESKKWQLLEKTTNPLLITLGEKDEFIKPSTSSAAQLIKEKSIAAKSINVHLIKGATHSYIGQEEKLVSIIAKWVNNFK